MSVGHVLDLFQVTFAERYAVRYLSLVTRQFHRSSLVTRQHVYEAAK